MHACGVAHRDISPNNLLLRHGDLKIADLGMARVMCDSQEIGLPAFTLYVTTKPYRAPELIRGLATYSTQIDVWSAGCVIFELLTGRPPPELCTEQGFERERLRGMLSELDARGASEVEKMLLRGMLVEDPAERETCESLLRKVWQTTVGEAEAAIQRRAVEAAFGLERRQDTEEEAEGPAIKRRRA